MNYAALAGLVGFTWALNQEPDVAGYRLYWGPEPGVYTNSSYTGPTNEAWLPPMPGRSYYALSALSSNGWESPLSQELSKTNNLLVTQVIEQSGSLSGPWLAVTSQWWTAHATNGPVFFRGVITVRRLDD